MRMGSLEVVGIQLRGCAVATHGEGTDMIQYQRGKRNVRVFGDILTTIYDFSLTMLCNYHLYLSGHDCFNSGNTQTDT